MAEKRKAKFRVGQVVLDTGDDSYCRIVKILKDGITWVEMERGGTRWTLLQKRLRHLTRQERGA